MSAAGVFTSAWLPVAVWTLDLSLGALLVRWLHDVAGGGWGEAARRSMHLAASALPVGLAASLLLGWIARQQLHWLDHPRHVPGAFVADGPAAIRAVAYAVAWCLLARASGAWQDEAPGRRPRLGSLALVVHLPIATLFAFDAFAALQPGWFSTALGPRYVSSQAVAGFAVVTLLQCMRAVGGRAPADQARQDLGTLLFASIVFWVYIAFMQFLIIWIGDLPREIGWYLDRSAPGWIAVLCAALALKAAIPGVLLCSRRVKRDARVLGTVAALVLAGHLLDLVWQMSPPFAAAVWTRWLLIPAALGALGGCWALVFSRRARRDTIPRQAASGAGP